MRKALGPAHGSSVVVFPFKMGKFTLWQPPLRGLCARSARGFIGCIRREGLDWHRLFEDIVNLIFLEITSTGEDNDLADQTKRRSLDPQDHKKDSQ